MIKTCVAGESGARRRGRRTRTYNSKHDWQLWSCSFNGQNASFRFFFFQKQQKKEKEKEKRKKFSFTFTK